MLPLLKRSPAGRWSTHAPLLPLIQLEVDIDLKKLLISQPRRQRVDFQYLVRGGEHGFVHDRVSGGTDDLALRDRAIPPNPNLERCDEILGGPHYGSRLLPSRMEAVVDH